MPRHIAIVGFTTRSAVGACRQLGIQPDSFDVFADHDTRRDAAQAHTIEWKRGGSSLAATVPAIQQWLEGTGDAERFVLLAGGMENWGELVDQLQLSARVLGPTATQLHCLRQPAAWYAAAKHAGARFPLSQLPLPAGRIGDVPAQATRPNGAAQSRMDRDVWLTKPLMGAGGAAIQRTAAGADEPPPTGHYLQRLVAGRVLGAHFVCHPTTTRLLGITASWVADEWLAPSEFIYRGSWGPLSLEQLKHGRQEPNRQSIERQVVEIAEHLRRASGILGWMQLDLILDCRGDLWLIDVNPRWSAGMEVLLDSGQCNPLLDHLQAYGFALVDGQLVDRLEQAVTPTFDNGVRGANQPAREPACSDLRNNSAVRCLSAKGVVYACESFRCTAQMLQRWQALPDVADIPSASMAGSIVQAGEPLMTVKASVATPCDEGEAKQQLLQQLNEAREKLLADIQPARI